MSASKPSPATAARIPEPFATALTAMPLQVTFTLKHGQHLRNHLAARIESHGVISTADAIAIAEGLIDDELIDPEALRQAALAADRPENCTESSCDGPREHDHGPNCGPLCPCGKGN